MFVKVSTTVVIISDSGKEVIRATGKAQSTMSSGIEAAAKRSTVEKVVAQAVDTATKAVDGVL